MSTLAYQASDIIEENVEPFAKLVRPLFKEVICDNCFKVGHGKLKRCNNCKSMFYCDRKCQNEDWKRGHKIECSQPYLKTLLEAEQAVFGEGDLDGPTCRKLDECFNERFLLRMWSLLKMKPHLAEKKVRVAHNDSMISFNDVIAKFKDVMEDNPQLVSIATKAAVGLNKDANESVDFKTLVDIQIVTGTTSGEICDDTDCESIGRGCYLQIATFKHSCKPNVHLSTFGGKHHFRAVAPIEAGEEPTVCIFGQEFFSKVERRKLLLEGLKMDCQCQLCASDVEDNLDYENLLNQVVKLINSPFAPGDEKFKTASDLIEFAEQLVTQLRTLYHPFDKRIALVYTVTLYSLSYFKLDDAPMEMRSKFVEDFKTCLSNTYGDEYCRQDSVILWLDLVIGKIVPVGVPVRDDEPFHFVGHKEIPNPDSEDPNDKIWVSRKYALKFVAKEDLDLSMPLIAPAAALPGASVVEQANQEGGIQSGIEEREEEEGPTTTPAEAAEEHPAVDTDEDLPLLQDPHAVDPRVLFLFPTSEETDDENLAELMDIESEPTDEERANIHLAICSAMAAMGIEVPEATGEVGEGEGHEAASNSDVTNSKTDTDAAASAGGDRGGDSHEHEEKK